MERPDPPQPEHHPPELTCCCGRVECPLLKKNCSILEAVEKDVHTAAQLGQVRTRPLISKHSLCESHYALPRFVSLPPVWTAYQLFQRFPLLLNTLAHPHILDSSFADFFTSSFIGPTSPA